MGDFRTASHFLAWLPGGRKEPAQWPTFLRDAEMARKPSKQFSGSCRSQWGDLYLICRSFSLRRNLPIVNRLLCTSNLKTLKKLKQATHFIELYWANWFLGPTKIELDKINQATPKKGLVCSLPIVGKQMLSPYADTTPKNTTCSYRGKPTNISFTPHFTRVSGMCSSKQMPHPLIAVYGAAKPRSVPVS